MKKMPIILVSFILLFSFFSICYAETTDLDTEAMVDNNTGIVTISGTSSLPSSLWKGNSVTITISLPNTNILGALPDEKSSSNTKLGNIAVCIEQTELHEDGSFNFTYQLPNNATSGKYTARVFVNNEDTVREKEFSYINIGRHKEALEKLQSEGAVVREILDNYINDINVEKGILYATFNEEEKQYISDNITDINNFENQLDNAFKKIELLHTFKGSLNENTGSLLELNKILLGLDETAFSRYCGFIQVQKDQVVVLLYQKIQSCALPDKISGVFTEAVTEEYNKSKSSAASGPASLRGSSKEGNSSITTSGIVLNNNEPIEAPEKIEMFNDLEDVKWAKTAIETLANKNVVNGKNETEFCPNDLVTREEFLKILAVAFEISVDNSELSFKDVNKDAWYYKYIAQAVKYGIVTGISETEFGIGQPISRQDMAVLTYRAVQKDVSVELYTVDNDAIFGDMEKVGDYAIDAVQAMAKAKIINGKGNGLFEPDGNATRAEAVQIIYNVLYK